MCGLKLLEIDEDSVGVCTSRARSDKCMEVFNRQGVYVACASLNPARKEKKNWFRSWIFGCVNGCYLWLIVVSFEGFMEEKFLFIKVVSSDINGFLNRKWWVMGFF